MLPQSTAINRYLAKQFGALCLKFTRQCITFDQAPISIRHRLFSGFAGKTPFDEARVDTLADQFKAYISTIMFIYFFKSSFLQDYWADLVPFTYVMYSKDKDPVKAL